MTKVSATERQIDRIALYSSSNAALRLCPTHQRELRQTMTRDVRKLVESPFFQTQFASYLPSLGNNGAHMSITTNGLQVQKLQYDDEAGAWDVVEGTAIVELTGDGATNEGLQISQEMISDADHVYQRCLRAHQADGSTDSHQVSRIDLEEGPLPTSHRSLRSHETARPPLLEEWQRVREESSQLRRRLEEAERTRSSMQSQVEELLRARNTAPATLMDAKLLQTCLALAEQFAVVGPQTEPPRELMEAFNRLDPKVRDSVFFHIYLLNSSERYDDWNLGRYYFFNEHQHGQDFKATNAQRALAIRHFVLEHLAENFETARTSEMASAAMAVFGSLPTEEKNNVYRHLWHLLRPSPREDHYRYGEFAFLSQQGKEATHIQRGRAIANHLQEKLMEHRRGLIDRAMQRLTGELASVERKAVHFEKEHARVQLELEAIQRKLDTAAHLASRIPNLEADLRDAQTQIARISRLEHDLDAARRESQARQKRIEELEKDLQAARLIATRVPALESELHAAQKQAARVPGLEHDLDMARRESKIRQERIEELDKDLQAARLIAIRVPALESELQAAQIQVKRIPTLENDLDALRLDNDMQKRRMEELAAQQERDVALIDALRAELESAALDAGSEDSPPEVDFLEIGSLIGGLLDIGADPIEIRIRNPAARQTFEDNKDLLNGVETIEVDGDNLIVKLHKDIAKKHGLPEQFIIPAGDSLHRDLSNWCTALYLTGLDSTTSHARGLWETAGRKFEGHAVGALDFAKRTRDAHLESIQISTFYKKLKELRSQILAHRPMSAEDTHFRAWPAQFVRFNEFAAGFNKSHVYILEHLQDIGTYLQEFKKRRDEMREEIASPSVADADVLRKKLHRCEREILKLEKTARYFMQQLTRDFLEDCLTRFPGVAKDVQSFQHLLTLVDDRYREELSYTDGTSSEAAKFNHQMSWLSANLLTLFNRVTVVA